MENNAIMTNDDLNFDSEERQNGITHAEQGEAFISSYLSDDSDYLMHYGRKGMKWGQHIFGKVKTGAKAAGKKTVELTKKGYSKAKRARELHKKVKEIDKLRKKPIKDLTDEELNARLKRLELEKRVSDLQKQTATMTAGQAFLGKIGKDVLVPAVMNAGKEVLERWLKKQGYDIAGLKDTQYGAPKGWKEAEESLLRKNKLANDKQAATLEDEIKNYAQKKAKKATEERVDKEVEDNIRRAEANAKKSAEKAAKKSAKKAEKAAKEDRKVYTGTVSGEGTSKRKTETKKPKPDNYYDPIYTTFTERPYNNVRNTTSYQRGLGYVERLLLNP